VAFSFSARAIITASTMDISFLYFAFISPALRDSSRFIGDIVRSLEYAILLNHVIAVSSPSFSSVL